MKIQPELEKQSEDIDYFGSKSPLSNPVSRFLIQCRTYHCNYCFTFFWSVDRKWLCLAAIETAAIERDTVSAMQDVEYSVWARNHERSLRHKAMQTVRGAIPKFSMAFQPIVNVATNEIFAYESLVRSVTGESAPSVLRRVPQKNFHLFDKACRSMAIDMAMTLGLTNTNAALCVNVNPKAAIEENTHLRLTCNEAVDAGFPMDRLVLEFVEDAEMCDPHGMKQLVREYQNMGVRIAIDDFGAGYSGLSLLANLRPDIVKLDMGLVSRVDTDHGTAILLRATAAACRELGTEVIAEGVERIEQMHRLTDMGILLQQGYLYARPGFEKLPLADFHVKAAKTA